MRSFRVGKWTVTIVLLVGVAAGCGGRKGSPSGTTPTSPSGTFPSTLKMYSSLSPSGGWSSQTVTVTGSDALGLVDPSPIRMPDDTILLYYLMSYQSAGDPAASQPNNQWKMGVAQSTDNGLSFTHKGVAFTFGSSTTDPFPMMLDSVGTIRLLASQGTNVPSVTAIDTTGLSFASIADAGFRSTSGGVPGALRIGLTYYLYACGSGGIIFSTSADGLNFTPGGTAIAASGGGTLCDPSPIDAGGGTYLMAFKRGTGAGPQSDVTYMASSTNGVTWTETGQVGAGSVPGLVKDRNGVLRIYVVGF